MGLDLKVRVINYGSGTLFPLIVAFHLRQHLVLRTTESLSTQWNVIFRIIQFQFGHSRLTLVHI